MADSQAVVSTDLQPIASAVAAPVGESRRLTALDATRGFALLGILMVNIQSFAEPFGRFVMPTPEATDPVTQSLFYFVKILCEGRFYPLFSMLFGMGLILQMGSIESSGGRFRAIYLRRLLVLLLIGALHAMLLWYGDILFIYAICGVVLMLCSRLRGRTLLTIGIAMLLGVSILGGTLFGWMSHASQHQQAAQVQAVPRDPPAPPDKPGRPDDLDHRAQTSPFCRLMNAYRDRQIRGGPETPLWIEMETRAYRDGPWIESFLFRASTWALYLLFCLLGFGWTVLAAFFIGAGLAKLNLFSPERRALRKRLILLGLVVGLPGAAVGALAPGLAGGSLALMILAGICTMAVGPLVSLLYLCTITRIVESGAARGLVRTLSAVGRMALTNYLTHTLVCTFIFYHWGLAQFAQWSRSERVLLVLGIFAAQCILSPLWLSVFRFGPFEWCWRTLTYGRLQPMRRETIPTSP